MSAALATLIGTFVRTAQTDTGEIEITFAVAPGSRWLVPELVKDLKKLIAVGKDKVSLTVKQYRKERSSEQNHLLWALLERMAREMGGGRTAWDAYLAMIDRYGAKYEYLQCTKVAFPTLKEMFRAIRVVEERNQNGVETLMCKAYMGSSQYNTQEMARLIEGVFDELKKLGIDAAYGADGKYNF